MTFLTSKFYYRLNQLLAVTMIPSALAVVCFGRFHESVTADGIVERAQQVMLTSSSKETRIEEIYVKEGDLVKEGQPLFRFTDVNGVKNSLDRQKLALSELKKRFQDMAQLNKTGAIPRHEYDSLETSLRQKENEVKDLTEQADRLAVCAPFAGRVLQILPEVYESCDIGSPLASLGAEGWSVLVCNIPEKMRTFLKPGLRVNIRSTQYNYIRYGEFMGVIESISLYTREVNGSRMFEIRVRMLDSDRPLPPGSTARADIQIGSYPFWQLVLSQELSK